MTDDYESLSHWGMVKVEPQQPRILHNLMLNAEVPLLSAAEMARKYQLRMATLKHDPVN
jgi:hypothetical protein